MDDLRKYRSRELINIIKYKTMIEKIDINWFLR